MVSFNDIPDTKLPFFYVEFDDTRAAQGVSTQPYRGLMIGQKTSAGTATADLPVRVFSAAECRQLCGPGSMGHLMGEAWFKENASSEIWLVPMDDAGGSTAAAGTITVTGTATAAGSIVLYMGGQRTSIAVASGDVQNAIATAIQVEIATAIGTKDYPITATVATNVVTITAKNKGAAGNDIDVRLNHNLGEALPAGVTVVIVEPASGATNPDVTTLWTALGDSWFNVWAVGFGDATTLTDLNTELEDRWKPIRSIEGHAFVGQDDTFAALVTLGAAQNSKHISLLGMANSLRPSWEWAASVAAVVMFYGQIDQARQFKTLPLTRMLAPTETDLFTNLERATLLDNGISTWVQSGGGVIRIERLITGWLTNAAGAPSEAYLNVNTKLTLGYLRYTFRNWFLVRYPRHKLADDGVQLEPNQPVITPSLGRVEAINVFREWELQGRVENAQQFIDDLVVEKKGDRLEFVLSPDLINNFRTGAAQFAFIS